MGWLSWAQIAWDWEAAQGKPEDIKTFRNTVLGETWQEQGEAPDWEAAISTAVVLAADAIPARPKRGDQLTLVGTDYLVAEVRQDICGASFTLMRRKADRVAVVSAREAVFAAIAARLAALLVEPVERNRDDQIDPDQCPRLVLFDGDQQRLPDDGQGYGVLAYEISAQLRLRRAADARRDHDGGERPCMPALSRLWSPTAPRSAVCRSPSLPAALKSGSRNSACAWIAPPSRSPMLPSPPSSRTCRFPCACQKAHHSSKSESFPSAAIGLLLRPSEHPTVRQSDKEKSDNINN